MKKHFLQLGKDTLIYGIGGALTRGIALFLLPLYTRIFSPEEFGTIEMLAILSLFLKVIMNMGLDSAQSFFYFKQNEQKEKAQLISSIIQLRIVVGIVFLILVGIFSPGINKLFFSNQLSTPLFLIALGETFFLLISEQLAGIFRLNYKPIQYFSINLARTICSALFILLFTLGFNWSILGYFAGLSAGSLLASILGLVKNSSYLSFGKIHHQKWKEITKFSSPLIGSALALYLLNATDRWFVNLFLGAEQLGIYAVGLKFVSIITLFSNTFRLAWQPISFELLDNPEGKVLFRTVARLFLGIGICIIVLLTTFSKLIVGLFTPLDYIDAYQVIGILSWGSIMLGLYPIVSMGIWKTKKTHLFTTVSIIAAISGVGLNYFLTPEFGIKGAAISSAISFCLLVIITLKQSEKLWAVKYNIGIMLTQITLGIISCIFIQYFLQAGVGILVPIIISLTTVVLLIFISINKKDQSKLLAVLGNRKNNKKPIN